MSAANGPAVRLYDVRYGGSTSTRDLGFVWSAHCIVASTWTSVTVGVNDGTGTQPPLLHQAKPRLAGGLTSKVIKKMYDGFYARRLS